MPRVEAKRTLVKSPPELWAELSDPVALGRHLEDFGEVRIVRVETEALVEWEADRGRGRVELAPSGWGTRVTLSVEASEAAPVARPPAPAVRDRPWWARLLGPWQRPDPGAEPPVEAAPPASPERPDPEVVLRSILDTLGTAHHRPYSRA